MEGLAASPFRAMLPSMSASEAKGIGAGSVIRRKADGGFERVTDEVVIEEPLEIRIGESPLAVTMQIGRAHV